MHPFESAGLGKAPFRFAGCENRVGPVTMADGITQIGSPGQPMGTCAYCGQGIALCMSIKSADGKRFTVGSDCVEKLYRDSNVETTAMERAYTQDRVYQEIKAAKLKHQRELRHKRDALKIAEGRAFVERHQALLESVPSVTRAGESVWDRYEWFMRNAGNTGKLKIIKELRAFIYREFAATD